MLTLKLKLKKLLSVMPREREENLANSKEKENLVRIKDKKKRKKLKKVLRRRKKSKLPKMLLLSVKQEDAVPVRDNSDRSLF